VLLQAVIAVDLAILGSLWLADLVAPVAEPRLSFPAQARGVLFYAILPALALAAIRLLSRARLEPRDDLVALHPSRRTTYEIPRTTIAAVEPWRLPLPRPGLRLRLASGRLFPHRLAAADPTALVAALAPRHATAGWVADARARHRSRVLHHAAVKLALLPLVPTFLLFRVQQLIAGGDLLGEYRLHGLWKYLDTLLGTWIFVMAHVVVWAAIGRAVVEAIALPGRALPGERAAALRWGLEIVAFAVYLGGIALGLWRIFYG
jgi:apolipoprotein N-acyltransferase